MSHRRRIVVLGGGISGLSYTYFIQTLKHKVLTVAGAVKPEVGFFSECLPLSI